MKSSLAWCMILTLLAAAPLSGEVGGEKGRSKSFKGRLSMGATPAEQCTFTVEVEEIGFRLNSYRDKYKLIRMRVENMAGVPLRLSAEEDTIELQLPDGQAVPGTFDLAASDPSSWDVLDETLRAALAYPLSIRAARGDNPASRRPEVIYLYMFFPAGKVTAVPRAFRYAIKSTGQTLLLEPPPATAARN